MKSRLKRGFTLPELLIVVAIIGVLVAVSIPIFTSQLRKAKIATNEANVRSAKAAAVADYLGEARTGGQTYTYTVQSGSISAPTAGSAAPAATDTDSNGIYDTIGVYIAENGTTVVTNPTEADVKTELAGEQ